MTSLVPKWSSMGLATLAFVAFGVTYTPLKIPSWPPLSDTSNNHSTIQSIETSSRIAKFRDWPSECCGIAGPKTSASRYKTVFTRINHDVWPLSSSKGRCLLHHEEKTPTDSFDRRHCWNSRLPLCVWRSGVFYEDMHSYVWRILRQYVWRS